MTVKRLILTVSLCGLPIASAAAADLPVRAPPVPPTASAPIESWSGLYVGGNAGYGFSNGTTSFSPLPNPASFVDLRPTTLNPNPNGFLGGGQIGYNLQTGGIVFGGEADFQGSRVRGLDNQTPIIRNDGTSGPLGTSISAGQRLDWFGTARARVGTTVVSPRMLAYVTGGLAYGRERFGSLTTYTGTGGAFYSSHYGGTSAGWTAGAGIEYILFSHVSVKVEYLHAELRSYSAVANPSLDIPFQVGYRSRTDLDTVRAGINYRFGPTTPPVIARY